jgi:hypothetical protein
LVFGEVSKNQCIAAIQRVSEIEVANEDKKWKYTKYTVGLWDS